MKDQDDEWFLNIFHLCGTFDEAIFKFNLLEMLKEYKNDEKIKNKIMWMIGYYNSWFGEYEYRITKRHKITEEEVKRVLL